MDNDLHDIDKLFLNSLEPNEENPSAQVWETVNKKLNEDGHKKPSVWYTRTKRLLIILLIIGLGFCSYQFLFPHKLIFPHKYIVTKKTNLLQLPKSSDTLKKENIEIENKTIPTKIFAKKANADKDLSDDENKQTDTITKLDKKNKADISSIKNKLIKTINTHKVANNKNIFNSNEHHLNNKEIIIVKNKEVSTNKISNNNKANKAFVINKDVTKNLNGNSLKDVNNSDLNVHKKNSINVENEKSNQNFIDDDTRLLNAKTILCDVNNISTLQPITTFKQIENAHLPLLNLIKDSAVNKAAVKKQTFVTKSRFYISAFAAPEWQGFQLKDNDDQQNSGASNRGEDTKNKIKHREDEDASLVAGIGIGYRLSKKLSIESGLRYSEYDIRTDSLKLYAAVNTTTNIISYKINTSLGYGYLNTIGGSTPAIGDSMVASNLRQSVNYLSMPLLLRYETGKGRISFNPGFGLVFNFILNSNIRTSLKNEQKQIIHLQGLKKIWVGVVLTPAVYYRVSNRISFGLEPYFNYTISPINKATVVDSHPYGIGVGASVRYHF